MSIRQLPEMDIMRTVKSVLIRMLERCALPGIVGSSAPREPDLARERGVREREERERSTKDL
jgi:hypothetical protein